MVLKHHPLNPFDRKPQGAVATGGQVRLRLTVEDEQAPVELFLRVWNGDERRYPMRPLGLKDGRMIYEAQIGVGDKPRLLWYRFECEYKGEHVVLGAPGDHTGCGEGVMGSEESFQLTVYDAAYDTPAWMRDVSDHGGSFLPWRRHGRAHARQGRAEYHPARGLE